MPLLTEEEKTAARSATDFDANRWGSGDDL